MPFEGEFLTARIRYPMCASPPPPSGRSIEFKQLYNIREFGYQTLNNKKVIAKIKDVFTLRYIRKTLLRNRLWSFQICGDVITSGVSNFSMTSPPLEFITMLVTHTMRATNIVTHTMHATNIV